MTTLDIKHNKFINSKHHIEVEFTGELMKKVILQFLPTLVWVERNGTIDIHIKSINCSESVLSFDTLNLAAKYLYRHYKRRVIQDSLRNEIKEKERSAHELAICYLGLRTQKEQIFSEVLS